MSETPDNVLPSTEGRKCCKCDEPAHRKDGGSYYCVRHIRFSQMRRQSKYDGKLVPAYEWLESSVPEGMVCPCCNQRMTWTRKEGGPVISIQHDRSGDMRLMCILCNVRHAAMPGDTFYSLPDGHWKCVVCGEIKPTGEFYFNSRGARTACRPCQAAKSTNYSRARRAEHPEKIKNYVDANREKLNAYGREWGSAHRAQLTAIHRKYVEANRDAINASTRKWREANRDRINAAQNRRYAARRDAAVKDGCLPLPEDPGGL